MNLKTWLPIVSITFASLGCAAVDESSEASVDALEETPAVAGAARISANELAAKAEARYAEVEAATPNTFDGKSTVVFAVDDDAPVVAEDKQLKVVLPTPFGTPTLQITAATTSPIFYVTREGTLTVGTSTCRAANAGVIIIKTGEDRYRPAADLPCTVAITKVYLEDFGTGAAAAHAHAVHMRERTIVVGTITTQVKNAAGVTLDVRAAFVLPTPTPFH